MVGVLAGVPRSSARVRRTIFLVLLASTGITVLYSLLSYAVLPDRAAPGFQNVEQQQVCWLHPLMHVHIHWYSIHGVRLLVHGTPTPHSLHMHWTMDLQRQMIQYGVAQWAFVIHVPHAKKVWVLLGGGEYTHMHVLLHTCAHTHMCSYIHVLIHTCTPIYMCSYTHR